MTPCHLSYFKNRDTSRFVHFHNNHIAGSTILLCARFTFPPEEYVCTLVCSNKGVEDSGGRLVCPDFCFSILRSLEDAMQEALS